MKKWIAVVLCLCLMCAAAEYNASAPAGDSGDWYALGVLASGEKADLSEYERSLNALLRENKALPAATRQRTALLMKAFGLGQTDFARETPDATIGKQGIMSLVFGLHLLSNGFESELHTPQSVIAQILSLEKPDGGWAVSGQKADADVTAMTLQALAPYTGADMQVREAVNRGLDVLSRIQADNGGYLSYGNENAESAAQVIIALTALGIDPETDERFIKNGFSAVDAMERFCLPEGGVSHLPGGPGSEMAAAQAYLARAALKRFDAGKGSVFLLDELESAPPAEKSNLRTILLCVIGGLCLIAVGVLRLRGKRSVKSYLLVFGIALALCAAVLCIDVKTPGEYYRLEDDGSGKRIGSVTMAIRCDKAIGLADHVPSDGVLLEETEFPICEGDTAYDLLVRAVRERGMLLQADGPSGGKYVRGIENIGEFDFGDLSGWVYLINGEQASVSCSALKLKPDDRLEWVYTLELGADVYTSEPGTDDT